jgi:hypothetical protein
MQSQQPSGHGTLEPSLQLDTEDTDRNIFSTISSSFNLLHK